MTKVEQLKKAKNIELAKQLLETAIESADALNPEPYTEEKRNNSRIVLGFLNAFNNTQKIEISWIRISDLPEKIKAVKKFSKRL